MPAIVRTGCPLLALPRELRSIIYAHTSRSCRLGATEDGDVADRASLTILTGPEPGLLRTCTQIHDEYGEVWMKDMQLGIVAGSALDLSLASVQLSDTLAHTLLTSLVKECQISVDLIRLCSKQGFGYQIVPFMQNPHMLQTQLARLEWTPTKHMIINLRTMLAQMRRWLPNVKKLQLALGWPRSFESLEATVDSGFFEAARLRALEDGTDTDGPLYGKDCVVTTCVGFLVPKQSNIMDQESGTDTSAGRPSAPRVGTTDASTAGSGDRLVTVVGGGTYTARDSEDEVMILCRPLAVDSENCIHGKSVCGLEPMCFRDLGRVFGESMERTDDSKGAL